MKKSNCRVVPVLFCAFLAATVNLAANVLVFEGRIIPPPEQTTESYNVCLEHHEGRHATPPSSFLIEYRPDTDGMFRIEAEARAGEEQYTLYIRDGTGRAVFGYPHLSKSRDFGEITLRDDCELSGTVWTPDGAAGAGLTVAVERRLEDRCTHYLPAGETVADADGVFVFQQINPGKYRVQAKSDNYTHPPVEIDVGDDLSYVEINLTKAFAISGRVVSNDGQPVPGATVRADRRPAVQTGDDGHYRIAGLGADTYSVRAWTDNLAVENYADVKMEISDADMVAPDISLVPTGALRVVLDTEKNATAVLPERLRIRLRSKQNEADWFGHRADAVLDGETALFDNLAPGNYQLSLMEKTLGEVQADVTVASGITGEVALKLPEVFTLEGIVVDEEGQPLRESQIMLTSAERSRQNISSYHHAYSDKEGRFELVGLPRGSGMLRITAEKHVPLVKEVTLPVEEDEYRFTVTRGMIVAVRLVDEEGQPVVGVEVKLQPPDKERGNFYFYHDRSAKSEDGSGADGIAILHGVEPGKYEAHIEAPEHYADPQPVEIQAGTDRLDDITLQRGKALGGTVSEADGTPVANAHISAYRTDVGSGFSRRSFVSRQTQTDDNGAFSISGLPDGLYTIQVTSGRGYGEHYGELMRLNEVSAGSEDIMIILGEKQMLTVQVLDPDKNPVKEAKLIIARHDRRTVRHDPSSFRRTDNDGRFTTEIRRGFEYMIEARKIPWMDVKQHLDLTADGELPEPLILGMRPGLVFSGTVVDNQGRERGDVFVAAGDREPMATDAKGQFTIEGLAPGVVNVKVYADNDRGNLLAMQRLILSETEAVGNVRIELPELGKISGIVCDSDGNPLVNTVVHLSLTDSMPRGYGESFNTQTRTDGSFEFADLIPGDYGIVIMQSESVMPFMRTVKLNPGEAVTVNLPDIAPAGVTVKGSLSLDGAPLPDQPVILLSLDDADTSTMVTTAMRQMDQPVRTDSEGRFEFDNIRPGQHLFRLGSIRYSQFGQADEDEISFATRIDIAEGQTTLDIIVATAFLQGIVEDAEGQPIGAAVLSAQLPDADNVTMYLASRFARTDKDGRFIIRHLLPEPYRVNIADEDRRQAYNGILTPGEDGTEHRIRLERGRLISGTVRLEPGGSVERAFVMALTETGAVAGGGAIKTDGSYEIEPHLPAGRYAIIGIHTDLAGETAIVDLQDDLVHDFVFKPGGDLSVKLQGPAELIADRDIIIEDQDGNPVQRLRIAMQEDYTREFLGVAVIPPTDAEGNTKARKLPAGKYTVRLNDEISTEIIVVPFGETSAVLNL